VQPRAPLLLLWIVRTYLHLPQLCLVCESLRLSLEGLAAASAAAGDTPGSSSTPVLAAAEPILSQ
jgi:hypothetical protein